MSAVNRKLKILTLDLGGAEFAIQLKSWKLNNDTGDGTTTYTYAPTGTFVDPADDAWSLDLTFFSDWTVNGISDYLTAHDTETMTFQIDHHSDITGEHVRWVGSLAIKAPSVGGDVRTTEETAVKFICAGKPVYSRP